MQEPWLGVMLSRERPTGRLSTTTTSGASSGPLFLTVIPYEKESPGVTSSADADIVRDRSADGAGVGVGVGVGMFPFDGVGAGVPGSGDAVGGADVGVGLAVGPGMTAVSCAAQLLFRSASVDEVETQTMFVTLAGPP